MEEKSSKTKIAAGVIILIAVIIGMSVYLAVNCDYKSILSAIGSADIKFIIPALLCFVLFVMCESTNIKRVCNTLGYGGSVIQYLKYGAAGFFFSGITPSSTGGQPMQLYYMHKDGIEVSHGSLALMCELMGFQAASIGIALFGMVYNNAYIAGLGSSIKLILMTGFILSFIILILLSVAIFLPPVAAFVERRFHVNMDSYKIGSEYIRKNPRVLMYNTATSFIQLLAMYSITFFTYMALYGAGANWLRIVTLQAVLSTGVSFVPIPGAAGAAEGGFRLIFAAVFGSMVMPAMLLSRGISLYLGLILTGCCLLVILALKKHTSAAADLV